MSNIDLYINFDGVGKILRYRDSVFYAVLNGIEQALPLDSGLRVQYSADNSSWHDTVTTGDKYIRVSTNSGATWQSGIKFAGDNGTNGITYTPYTAYASDDAGTGFSMTWNDTLKYTATVHSTTVLANPTLANFTSLGAVWKKFIGDPGQQGNPGNPGATYYPYTAYASAADGTGFSLTWNDTLKYTATVFSTSVIASPALSDFTTLGAVWKKFIGDKGDPGDPATNIITSVNSKTGVVVLNAADVGAEASGTVSTHNTDTGAHADKFGGKVDKITGKGLSTEDYTTAEKTKLSGIEAGAEVNVNADWNATSGDAQILNKPTIPDAQIQADWNQATDTAKDYIKNKPTIPTNSDFTLAGLSEKSYASLTDKPTIPAAQVQSDWNAASGMGQILNKPTIPSKTSDLTNDSDFTTSSAVSSGYVAKDGSKVLSDNNYDSTSKTKLDNLANITTVGTGLSLNSGTLAATGGASVPPGCVLPFAGSGTVPTGFLLCNGAAVSRTTYADLFTALGTTYGTGDGSTTFNIPDFRGRFLRGYDGTRSAAIGTAQADGLPNITGNVGQLRDASFSSGAFSATTTGAATDRAAASYSWAKVSFDASNSSSIYGNSSYVTPYNYAVQYIIKY